MGACGVAGAMVSSKTKDGLLLERYRFKRPRWSVSLAKTIFHEAAVAGLPLAQRTLKNEPNRRADSWRQ